MISGKVSSDELQVCNTSINGIYSNDIYIPSRIETINYTPQIWSGVEWRGNDNMLESYEILNVYKKNKIEKLEVEAKNAREKILASLNKRKEFEELVNSFEASVEQLYTSQFSEGQTESNVDYTELEIIKSNSSFYAGYKINQDYYSEDLKKIDEDLVEAKNLLNKELEPVKALLNICRDKIEIEEVLKRYEILDKNGKINLK